MGVGVQVNKSMGKVGGWFGVVLILVLLWELAWCATIVTQTRCDGGTCVIDKDLSLLFSGFSLVMFIAIAFFKSYLTVPKSWDLAIFIALAVQVTGVLDVWNEHPVDGLIPTTEVSIDNLVMIVAITSACLWWFIVERISQAETEIKSS
jgi:hypothetical protein